MAWIICNGGPSGIWAAIMFPSPESCGGDGGGYEMMGWWRIEPGACVNVYANDLEDVGHYWYYFARADNGEVWAGPFERDVSVAAFGGNQWCWGDSKTLEGDFVRIGYRELYVDDYDTYTLTLIP